MLSTAETDFLRGKSQARAELFEELSHETRIRILQALGEQPMAFAALKKALRMESSGNLQHHLGKLGGLVRQTDDGLYVLTEDGKEALRTLDMMRDNNRARGLHAILVVCSVNAILVAFGFTARASTTCAMGSTLSVLHAIREFQQDLCHLGNLEFLDFSHRFQVFDYPVSFRIRVSSEGMSHL